MGSNSSDNGCPYRLGETLILYEGKWAGLKQIPFTDPHSGEAGVWQVAYRTTKPQGALSDGAAVIPILTHADGKKYFVLVKQYRIPTMSWCIEFPAGMIDPNESITECALRELTEETGYTAEPGNVINVEQGPFILDPGICSSSQSMVTVTIDGGDKRNVNPEPKLQHGEKLFVLLIPCENILEELRNLATQPNTVVEAAVFTFALGYDLAKNN